MQVFTKCSGNRKDVNYVKPSVVNESAHETRNFIHYFGKYYNGEHLSKIKQMFSGAKIKTTEREDCGYCYKCSQIITV